MRYDKRFGRNVEVTEDLTLRIYEDAKKISRNKSSKVFEVLEESDIALSSAQIAELSGLPMKKA